MYYVKTEDCKEVATSLSDVWPIFEAIIDLARNNDWRQYACASVCTNCRVFEYIFCIRLI